MQLKQRSLSHRGTVDARGQAASRRAPLAHHPAEELACNVDHVRPPPRPAHHSIPHRTPHSLQCKAREAKARLGTPATHPQACPEQASQPIILLSPSRHLPHQLIEVNPLMLFPSLGRSRWLIKHSSHRPGIEVPGPIGVLIEASTAALL